MNQRDRQEDRCDSFLFLLSAFESISDPTVLCCDSSTSLRLVMNYSPRRLSKSNGFLQGRLCHLVAGRKLKDTRERERVTDDKTRGRRESIMSPAVCILSISASSSLLLSSLRDRSNADRVISPRRRFETDAMRKQTARLPSRVRNSHPRHCIARRPSSPSSA